MILRLLRVNIYLLSYKGKGFMKTKTMVKNITNYERGELDLSWKSNSAAQRLLDVIAYIIANEYVCAVKENPALFSNPGGSK